MISAETSRLEAALKPSVGGCALLSASPFFASFCRSCCFSRAAFFSSSLTASSAALAFVSSLSRFFARRSTAFLSSSSRTKRPGPRMTFRILSRSRSTAAVRCGSFIHSQRSPACLERSIIQTQSLILSRGRECVARTIRTASAVARCHSALAPSAAASCTAAEMTFCLLT